MIKIEKIELNSREYKGIAISSVEPKTNCQCLVCGSCAACVIFIFLVGFALSISLGFALTNTQSALK